MMGDMDDLIAFLTARLDEDEQVAREATPGPWRVDSEPLFSGLHRVVTADYHEDPATGNVAGVVVVAGDDVGGADLEAAEHIARHNPARVLREVEAKRRIIEHNTCLHQMADPATHPDQEYVLAAGASDRVLRLLALPYADHRDYREEWRA